MSGRGGARGAEHGEGQGNSPPPRGRTGAPSPRGEKRISRGPGKRRALASRRRGGPLPSALSAPFLPSNCFGLTVLFPF